MASGPSHRLPQPSVNTPHPKRTKRIMWCPLRCTLQMSAQVWTVSSCVTFNKHYTYTLFFVPRHQPSYVTQVLTYVLEDSLPPIAGFDFRSLILGRSPDSLLPQGGDWALGFRRVTVRLWRVRAS